MAQPIRELHSETNKEVITLLLHQLNIIILHMCSCNIVPVSIETKLAKVLDIGTSALHCKSLWLYGSSISYSFLLLSCMY